MTGEAGARLPGKTSALLVQIASLIRAQETLAAALQAAMEQAKEYKERARLAEREVERLEGILEQERALRRSAAHETAPVKRTGNA
jgi:hypothetical protein